MNRFKFTDLFIFIVISELTGALSAILSEGSFSFYKELEQPPFSPPGWVFPVVWVVLYALMGISAYLIYSSGAENEKVKKALIVYGAQLLVNFSWSILFFGLKLPLAAAIIIILLIGLVSAMIVLFCRIRPIAAYLNIPYILWLIFAAYLNIGVVLLN